MMLKSQIVFSFLLASAASNPTNEWTREGTKTLTVEEGMHKHTSVEVSGSGQIITKDSPAFLSEKQVLSRRIQSTSVMTTVYVGADAEFPDYYYLDEEADDEAEFEGMSVFARRKRLGGTTFQGNFIPAARIYFPTYTAKDLAKGTYGSEEMTCVGTRDKGSYRHQMQTIGNTPIRITSKSECDEAAKQMARRFEPGRKRRPILLDALGGLLKDTNLAEGCYMANDETFHWNDHSEKSPVAKLASEFSPPKQYWPLTPICKLRDDQMLHFTVPRHGYCEYDTAGNNFPGYDVTLASVCKYALQMQTGKWLTNTYYSGFPARGFNPKVFLQRYEQGKRLSAGANDDFANFLLNPIEKKDTRPPGCWGYFSKRPFGAWNFVDKFGKHASSRAKKESGDPVSGKSICMQVEDVR